MQQGSLVKPPTTIESDGNLLNPIQIPITSTTAMYIQYLSTQYLQQRFSKSILFLSQKKKVNKKSHWRSMAMISSEVDEEVLVLQSMYPQEFVGQEGENQYQISIAVNQEDLSDLQLSWCYR